MIVIPAIDIIGNKAVRLYQGDYGKKQIVGSNILNIAKSFEDNGAQYVHIVDLEGAKEGRLVNDKTIIKLAKELSIPLEVGGGIRRYDDIEYLINNKVSRVILGTISMEDEDFVKRAVKDFGDKIAVGVDCKNGYLYSKGWINKSKLHYLDFSKRMEELGVSNLIITDISKDGTLMGSNTTMIKELKKRVNIKLTASGGVRDYYDIKKLKELDIYGVIVGKAIYSGNIDLRQAMNSCNECR